MQIVGRNKNIVYTKEEADAESIKYLYWKDVRKPGQWIISDDDYVLIV
jgi:hypothetical protein